MSPRVFVIVLNFNGADWLIACLGALLQTAYSDFSVIVVDNASTDDSLNLIRVKYPEIILLQNNRNDGFSAGNNLGIRYALERRADYVVLLNPDTKVKPDWLSRMIEVGEQEPSLGILGAVQLRYDNEDWNSWTHTALSPAQQMLLSSQGQCPAWLEMEWVEGSCFAIKRKVIKSVGLFDPIFFSFYEEIDYCRRARYHGFRTGLVTQSRLHHHRGGVWGATPEKQMVRDYQCDKSQFIYSLTAPDRAIAKNLFNYGQTFLSKVKDALVAMKYVHLLALARMQFSIWRQSLMIWRKWRADRLKLTGYGAI